ncbi:CRISPR-associated endonuclease Cas1 [Streptomyces atratus]|uniref:CRISPR-associated endonuclease Cas1 n=1 Tax=Streptomyces atratus TaxID=1893 RepID=UPI0036775877
MKTPRHPRLHPPQPSTAHRPCQRPAPDRFVLTLLNRRQLRPAHFETTPGGAVRLTDDGRKIVITAWQDWKAQTWEHSLAGRDVPAGLLPVVQARILARHLRGELPAYLPWTAA